MPEWNAPMDQLEVDRLALRDAIRHEIEHAKARVARWEPAPCPPDTAVSA